MTPDETEISGSQADGEGPERILVAYDRPEMLEVIDEVLGEQYLCEFVSSVGEARTKLAEQVFHLALCDVNAEGELGLALAAEITADHPNTAVVLVTAEDDPTIAKRAFALGAYGYLIEPLQPGQLLITTMNALRQRELELSSRAHSKNLEERVQKIIDMVPMPIYAKDATGHYVVANAKAEELAGLPRGEMIGLTDQVIMSSESVGKAAVIDRQIFDDGMPYRADEVVVIGGLERIFKTVKFPLIDEDGSVTAVGGISTDITAESESIQLRDQLSASQQEAIEELRLSRQETVERLARAIEHHDLETGQHVVRMAAVVAFLATQLNVDPEQVEMMRAAAQMHDVGKVAIPDAILRKPGSLTAAERAEMERHTLIGHQILADSRSELLSTAASIALTHHERFDGSGYPQGLSGDEIPLGGRITAVSDVFDALLSDRVYRPALPVAEVVKLIEKGRGTEFDPEVVDALLGHLDEVLSLRAWVSKRNEPDSSHADSDSSTLSPPADLAR